MAYTDAGREKTINAILGGLGRSLWDQQTLSAYRQGLGVGNPITHVTAGMPLEQQLAKKRANLNQFQRAREEQAEEIKRRREAANKTIVTVTGRVPADLADLKVRNAKLLRQDRRYAYLSNYWNMIRLWAFDKMGVPKFEAIRYTLENPAPEWMRS